MADKDDKVLCETPTPGKQGTRIDRWKYDLIKKVMLKVIPANNTGLAFQDLPDRIEDELSPEERKRLGSIMWYTTTVKLDLETKGLIERLPNAKPQRLRRAKKTRT